MTIPSGPVALLTILRMRGSGFRITNTCGKGMIPLALFAEFPRVLCLTFPMWRNMSVMIRPLGVLERLLQSVQAVKNENKVPGDWQRHINWLNDVISEVWRNRGPFPGAGSVLQFLGVEVGTAFHRQVLIPRIRKGENAWEYLLAVLEGRRKCEEQEYAGRMKQAAERWAAYSASRRQLLRCWPVSNDAEAG